MSRVTKRKGKMALKNVALCSSRPHLSTPASAPLAATDWRRREPKAKERSETGEGYWAHAAKEHSVSGCCSPQWLHPLGIPRAEQRETGQGCSAAAPAWSHQIARLYFQLLRQKSKQGWKDEGRVFSEQEPEREWCLPGQKLALGSKRTGPLSPPSESVREELGVVPGRAWFQFSEATREGGKEAQTHGTEGLRS